MVGVECELDAETWGIDITRRTLSIGEGTGVATYRVNYINFGGRISRSGEEIIIMQPK
jgi:hypothetical protein